MNKTIKLAVAGAVLISSFSGKCRVLLSLLASGQLDVNGNVNCLRFIGIDV